MRSKFATRGRAIAGLAALVLLVPVPQAHAGHRGGGVRIVSYNGSRFATSYAAPVVATPTPVACVPVAAPRAYPGYSAPIPTRPAYPTAARMAPTPAYRAYPAMIGD